MINLMMDRLENIVLAQGIAPILSAADNIGWVLLGVGVVGLFLLVALFVISSYGKLWLQAFMSGADVTVIVTAKVMAAQAGLDIDRRTGISTARLEAHYLAGGNVMNVIHAIIAAHRAGIDLDFDRAAAIDLAGRDVLSAPASTRK